MWYALVFIGGLVLGAFCGLIGLALCRAAHYAEEKLKEGGFHEND